MTYATTLPAFNIVSSTHIMSVICFKCVPEDQQILSAVRGSLELAEGGMQSDSRWLTCMKLWPVRCGLANGVEE